MKIECAIARKNWKCFSNIDRHSFHFILKYKSYRFSKIQKLEKHFLEIVIIKLQKLFLWKLLFLERFKIKLGACFSTFEKRFQFFSNDYFWGTRYFYSDFYLIIIKINILKNNLSLCCIFFKAWHSIIIKIVKSALEQGWRYLIFSKI